MKTPVAEPTHCGRELYAEAEFRVIDCDACGFAHVDPKPSVPDLDTFYRQAFFEEHNPDYLAKTERELDYWSAVVFESKERQLRKLLGGTGRILDVGCCGGFLLDHFRRRGWQGVGVEPSPTAAAWARERYGITVTQDFVENLEPEDHGEFDAVHMAFVLEHVRQPFDVLHKVRQFLRPGGVLCVEVPNDFNPLQQAIVEAKAQRPWWVCWPDHINYFDFASLQRTLERCGFDVQRRQATFPMELFLLMGQNYLGDDQVGGECHRQRMRLELELNRGGVQDPLALLYDGWAERGIGREVILYARRSEARHEVAR